MSYSDDSFFAIQKKAAALQRKILAKKKRESEARPDERPVVKKEDISIFADLDMLENDINKTKRDLDEYMSFTGRSIRNIPSMHNVSPLSRKILYALKKLNFRDVPESQLRDLKTRAHKVLISCDKFDNSVDLLNQIQGGRPRPKDEPFRRLYTVANQDIEDLFDFVLDSLSNVAGHNFLRGSGIPKRFL